MLFSGFHCCEPNCAETVTGTSFSPVFAARPAVLLDRDGTLIVEANYLSDPESLELIPTAPEAIGKAT